MSAIRQERTLTLGVPSGMLTSIVGLSGYIVVPLLTGQYRYLTNAAMYSGFNIIEHPLWYHASLLLLPSFLTMLVSTFLVHRWGITERTRTLKLLGGAISTPLVMVLLAYLATAVAFGVAYGASVMGESPLMGLISIPIFTIVALLFGVLALLYAMPIVCVGVVFGSASGHLLMRGVIRANERFYAD